MNAHSPITASEAQPYINLWRAALTLTLRDYRKQWLKAQTTAAKQAVEASACRYLRSRDGCEVFQRAGFDSNARSVAHAMAEITADPKASVMDAGQRGAGFNRIFGKSHESVGVLA